MSQSQGINPKDITQEMLDPLFATLMKATQIMIAAYLGFHALCYFLFARGKKFGRFYVKSLAWLGTFGFFLFALTSLERKLFATLLVGQAFLFIFVLFNFNRILKRDHHV